ncbi:threonine/serine dehydratase [Paenarthrobacter sp. NPDC089675]|uniref:threonine ammonia-lyase n=1 Tax=Paenarthrobacter sp. NPDC089675 TaxID=3364376 RepID=UPI00380AE2EF
MNPARPFGIEDIQEAAVRIGKHVRRTPIIASPLLDELTGARVLVKAEALQLTGAFKIRGALNKLLSMEERLRSNGVVAFSSGNHGQAISAAAKITGCPAVIVMPYDAPQVKIDGVEWWGAETVFYDPNVEDRVEVSRKIVEARGLTLVPPFDDYVVMAGQGTVGLEVSEDVSRKGIEPDAIVVPCSGGGLSSGVIEAMNTAYPKIQSYIVERSGFDKMARSLASGLLCTNPDASSGYMGAIGGPRPGDRPREVLGRYDIKGLTVTEKEATTAVQLAFRALKLVLEPGAAAALAAVMERKADFHGRTVVVVASGGNVDAGMYADILKQPSISRHELLAGKAG